MAGSRSVCIPTAAIIDFSGGKLTVTGPTATANIFATYLPDHMTLWRGFLDEVSGPGAGGPPRALLHSRRGQQAAPCGGAGKNPGRDNTESRLCQGWGLGALLRPLGLAGGPRCCHGASPQVVVTGMLQLCLLAITEKGNNPTLAGTQAIVIGILVVIIGVSLGMNSGYAINPSRDLPPRFFTFLAGWGSQVFRYCVVQPTPGSFLWVPCMQRVEQPRSVLQIRPLQAAAGEAGMGPDLPSDPAPGRQPCPRPAAVPEWG